MRSAIAFMSLLALAAPVAAQPITVQQPAVRQFSAGTTVSVPDRGSAFIGGVNTARSSRSTYGPLRSGTATGLERQAAAMSTGVFIHDFAAMDEAILAAAGQQTVDDTAAFAARLRQRRSEVVVSSPTPVLSKPRVDPARFEQLAEKAEQAGKWSVAKLHWQHAEKHGSTIATKRLQEWGRSGRPVAVK